MGARVLRSSHPTTRALAAVLVVVTLSVAGLAAPTMATTTTTATSDAAAYWLVASDGGIFSFGGAQFYGSMGGQSLDKPVVGMAAVPAGGGYWEVASDGGIFSFGSAQFYGSMGGRPLNQPIVGMAAVPGGGGYWEVAADGGVFAFGTAQFYGSTGGMALNAPIVSMAAAPGGAGYWFVAADGGIFAYGDSQFYGSLGSVPQSRPIVAIAAMPSGKGYWMTNDNGAVSSFGTATDWGSAPQVLNDPVVGMAEAPGTGAIGSFTVPAGSYGYDISNYQCTGVPPAPHAIGVVQVNGASFAPANRCLVTEVRWAGAGLNLYTFLTYGTMASSGDPACTATASPDACNEGFNAVLDAFTEAQTAGVDTSVDWWLDVEGKSTFWSSDTAANAALVQGAIDGLHFKGVNSVGIYASPDVWHAIVGTYQPSVPYWVAWWAKTAPTTLCTSVRSTFPDDSLPSGPVEMVQYSSPSYPYSSGGMTTAFDDDYAC